MSTRGPKELSTSRQIGFRRRRTTSPMFTTLLIWYGSFVESKEERRKREARERTRRWRERHPEYAERRRELQRKRYAAKGHEQRARQRKRYAIDPEPIRARNREWYSRNKEQRHQYYLARKAAQPPEVRRAHERERNRRRYLSDPAAWLAYQKQWRQRNPQKAHAYVRASNIKRRRTTSGEGFTSAEWLALLARYDRRCAYCGSDVQIEIDHRVPLMRGGSNLIDNILPACRRCNRRKHLMTEDEFRALLERERDQGV